MKGFDRMARKEKATREEILKNQEIIKNEPEFINVKTWSYILDEKKQEKKQEKKHYKKRKQRFLNEPLIRILVLRKG